MFISVNPRKPGYVSTKIKLFKKLKTDLIFLKFQKLPMKNSNFLILYFVNSVLIVNQSFASAISKLILSLQQVKNLFFNTGVNLSQKIFNPLRALLLRPFLYFYTLIINSI